MFQCLRYLKTSTCYIFLLTRLKYTATQRNGPVPKYRDNTRRFIVRCKNYFTVKGIK